MYTFVSLGINGSSHTWAQGDFHEQSDFYIFFTQNEPIFTKSSKWGTFCSSLFSGPPTPFPPPPPPPSPTCDPFSAGWNPSSTFVPCSRMVRVRPMLCYQLLILVAASLWDPGIYLPFMMIDKLLRCCMMSWKYIVYQACGMNWCECSNLIRSMALLSSKWQLNRYNLKFTEYWT